MTTEQFGYDMPTAIGFAAIPAIALLMWMMRKPLVSLAMVFVGLSAAWLTAFINSSPTVAQQAPAAPAPALPAPALPDLQQLLSHYEKIFSSWAMHSNFVAVCMVGVVALVVWMAIKLTQLHVENPRHVHYYDSQRSRALEHGLQERVFELEKPRDEEAYRANLPVKTK
jgi:hypothetical protein